MKKIYNFIFMFAFFSLSILRLNANPTADSISVTLYCDVTGSAVENAAAMYITGTFTSPGGGNWTFKPLTPVQPKIWKVTIKYLPGSITNDTTAYYFASANDWTEASREVVPAPCNRSWILHRTFFFNINKPDSSVAFKWGQCQAYKPSEILTGLKSNEKQGLVVSTLKSGLILVNVPSEMNGVNIELMNISGTPVRNLRGCSSVINLNVSDLPKGIYILKVSGDKKTFTRKILLN